MSNNRPVTEYCYENGMLHITNARIPFRPNFSGRPTQVNAAGGKREFCVAIDDLDVAQQLNEDGWNVRIRRPRDETEQPLHYLQVKVKYTDRSRPQVFMVTQKRKTPLDEESIDALDYAEIKYADMSLRPYTWDVNGKSGTAAYLTTLYAVIEEDRFADRYADRNAPDEDEMLD